MNVLVLGGDGFIGSHLVDRIFSLGHKVTVFDRFTSCVAINLGHLQGKISMFSGEFGNRETLRQAVAGQDVVYHCISQTTPASSWSDPHIEILNNLRNSVQLFEIAVDCGVKKVVFCSSGGTIYGNNTGLLSETDLPKPFSPYGICKLATENFLTYFHQRNNLVFDVYRIGNPFGPRQSLKAPQGVVAVWMGNILAGSRLAVYGDSCTVRDYIHVKDVAQLMAHSLADLAHSDTYNISSGHGVSILELLDIFKRVIGRPFEYVIQPRRDSDNTSVILDNRKIMSFFPDFAFKGLEEGIKEAWSLIEGVKVADDEHFRLR